MRNNDISTKITSLYVSQMSLVDLSKQNWDFRPRITSLYKLQTSPVVFAFKIATLGSELQVSMGPNPHQWFGAFKTATI